MKFVLSVLSTASLTAISPIPAAYSSNLTWSDAAASGDFAAPTDITSKNTFMEATGVANSLSAGNFACIRSGNIDVKSQVLEFNIDDQTGALTESLSVKAGADDVRYWQSASATFGMNPNLVDGSTYAAGLIANAGDIPVDIDTGSAPITWDESMSDDFTLYECCIDGVDVASDATVVLCPTLVYYGDTDGVIAADAYSTVANREYSNQANDAQNGSSAIATSSDIDTDFALAAQNQSMVDATAENNFCSDQQSTNTFVHDVTSSTSTLTVGFLDDSTATSHQAKCTWQIKADGAKAPSIKVEKFPSSTYTVQWVEWAVSTESNFDTSKLISSSLGSYYDFDPASVETFITIDKLYKFAPGAVNFEYEFGMYYHEADSASTTNALISDTSADQPIYSIQSAVIFEWIKDVKALETEYKKQLDAYNSDADDFNTDQETRTTEKEEGKPEEEMTELPERPCPPSVPSYPSSRYYISGNGAMPTGDDVDIANEFVIVPAEDLTTDTLQTYQLGTIATFFDTSQTEFDWDTVFASKTFGRLGQGEQEMTGVRLYVPDDAETNWEQWMMVSVFPDVQSAELAADENAEISASSVDLEALPDTWPTVSKGSVTELDSGAAHLIMSSVAVAATIAALY